MSAARLAGALFSCASFAFPRPLRVRVGPEMREAFDHALRARRRKGGMAAAGFTMRAIGDVVRTGLQHRLMPAPVPGRRGDGVMRETWADVRQGARRLRRTPGFTVAAVLLLALGIGANTAVFSALKAVVLTPLPFPSADRLVWLDLELGATPAEARALPWSYPKFALLSDGAAGTLEQVAGYGNRTVTLAGGGADPRRLNVEIVAGPYFETLGEIAHVGRTFTAEEAGVAEAPPAVVLGFGLWQDRFGSDPAVVGSTVEINGRAVPVVGVAPAGFAGLSGVADAWLPAPTAGQIITPIMVRARHAHWLSGIGRLADGVPVASASERLAGVARAVKETYPMEGLDGYAGVGVRPLAEARVNPAARKTVGVLMAAAAMVLLIACANLAGLLLARGRGRARDSAIRLALGAGRMRVARAALTESVVLAAAGGATGLLVAYWGIGALRTVWPQRFLNADGRLLRAIDLDVLRLDTGAVVFALAATALTVLLFGLIPALRTASVAPQETLRDTSAVGRGGRRSVRSLLVAGQMALALVLLVGAGLLLGSLQRLRDVPIGFDTGNLLVVHVAAARGTAGWDHPVPLREAIVDRISELPGVEAATLGCTPLNGICWVGGVTGIDGREADIDANVGIHMVPDGFFETLRVPVVAGRTFGPEDRDGSPPVVVLNRLAARAIFGDAEPLGRTVAVTADVTSERQAEVIGIVDDVLQGRPDEGPQPEAYFSERQMAESEADLIVRTSGDPRAQATAVRTAIRALDPTVVVDNVRTMDGLRRAALGDTRVLLVLLALFAAVAVALAAAGTWAIVALAVEERRRELGLRMALGARARELVAMVMRQGLAAALLGTLVGGWAAWGLSRLLAGLLFQTDAHEPAAFVGATLVLLAGAALASALPALRATRVDPARTLRAE